MSALQWTPENNREALRDGWLLNRHPKKKRWLSPGQRFLNAAELHGYLVQKGLDGSPLHIKALAYLYVNNKAEFLAAMKGAPANKTGALVKTIALMARVAGATTGGF